jgi:hypothetical protein
MTLKTLSALTFTLFSATNVFAVNIETVPIGNPDNVVAN